MLTVKVRDDQGREAFFVTTTFLLIQERIRQRLLPQIPVGEADSVVPATAEDIERLYFHEAAVADVREGEPIAFAGYRDDWHETEKEDRDERR